MITIQGKSFEIVTVDFETFYGKDFTLSKDLNVSEYIRDPRFKVHGVGIKKGDKPTKWFSGRQAVLMALRAVDWENSALLCHNTAFDGFILSEHYNTVPGFYLDSLSMSRAVHPPHMRHDLNTVAQLHGLKGKVKKDALTNTKDIVDLPKEQAAKLGEYCIDDVDDTRKIFNIMEPYFPESEFRLVDLTMRMFCDPVLEVDEPRAQAELDREVAEKKFRIKKAKVPVASLMSNNKFAMVLRKHGVEPPTKISPTTGKETFAFAKTDDGFKALQNHPREDIRDLAEARLRVKSTIGETRAHRLIEAGRDGQKLPVLLNYSGAHTHRWSGGNKLNLQNFTRGGELRKSIIAPPGHQVVVADSSQIEARMLAWVAGQKDILEAFRKKEDVYKLMASAIYNIPVDQITKDQRFIGKICVLALGYGMGAYKLHQTLRLGLMGPPVETTLDQCKEIVRIYRTKNNKIVKYWREADKVITNMCVGKTGSLGPLDYGKWYIRLPNGLFLHYPMMEGQAYEQYDDVMATEVTYQNKVGRSKLYGGLLTENIVQALARNVVAEQMLKVVDVGIRVATMTHDEIVAVVPDDQAEWALQTMLDTMSTPPEWAPDLPLAAEGGYAREYSKRASITTCWVCRKRLPSKKFGVLLNNSP